MPSSGQKVSSTMKHSSVLEFRFVVMGNMFCTELRIHRRYDLKEALLNQIEIDSKFLEAQHIMDYSLLLGVHYQAPQLLLSLMFYQGITADGLAMLAEEDPLENGIFNYPQSLVLVPRGTDDYSVVLGPHIRGSRLRASAAGDEEVDLLLPGTARLQIQLGVNMPARAELIPEKEETQMFHEAYDVVLYLGIIDILQDYNMSKKIEHAYKSLQVRVEEVSVCLQEENMELFMVVAWFIWSRRNKMHFNEQHMPPEKILEAATTLLVDFHGNNDSKPERNLVQTQRWLPPVEGIKKIDNPRFVVSLFIAWYTVSGWGKVDLCRSKSTGKALRIYSPILTYDLKSLFGALRNMALDRYLLSQFQRTKISHLFREAYRGADCLAKKACSMVNDVVNDFVVLNVPPSPDLDVILNSNIHGLYSLRLIANMLPFVR
nr:phosphatidylinositol 4-phosphate 5-kinase 9 [Quercus suber]